MSERFVWMIYPFLALLLLPNYSWADEQHYGYRITTPGKTVIQIARDVYNDERQWKKIAFWNNLTPPYALNVGQILVLPQKPKLEVLDHNLVTGDLVPAPKFLQQLPSVSRVVWDRKGYYVYEVNERAPSLSMVALENYGNKNMWKLIARWNGLATDEKLSLSQKLILHKKPTLTAKHANSVLIKEWVRVGNNPMAQRLGFHGEVAPVVPVKIETPAENKTIPTSVDSSTVSTPIQNSELIEPTRKPSHSNSDVSAPANSVPTVAIPAVPVPGVLAIPSLPSMPALPSLTSDEPASTGSKKLPPKKIKTVLTEPTSLGQPINTVEAPVQNTSPNSAPTLAPTPPATLTAPPPSNSNSRIIDPNDDPELAPQAEKIVQPTPAPTVQAPVVPQPTQTVPQPTQTVPQPTQTVQQPTQVIQPAPAQVTQPVQSTPTPAADPIPIAPTATIPAQPEPERKPTAATTSTDASQLPEPTNESYWLGSDTVNIMKSLSKPNGK